MDENQELHCISIDGDEVDNLTSFHEDIRLYKLENGDIFSMNCCVDNAENIGLKLIDTYFFHQHAWYKPWTWGKRRGKIDNKRKWYKPWTWSKKYKWYKYKVVNCIVSLEGCEYDGKN